jgi:heme-degrading monooxygenase HmoA
MLKHIVMWRLKEHAEGADKATNARAIKAALEGLRGRIPGMLALEVGLDVDRSPAAFDVVLYSEFESAEALAAYQVHPEHEKVAALIGRVRSERVVVDYEPE